MLDKKVIQYTKEGIVEKDLATGESRLAVKSDYAKEKKFEPPGKEKHYDTEPGKPIKQEGKAHLTDRPEGKHQKAGKEAGNQGSPEAAGEKPPVSTGSGNILPGRPAGYGSPPSGRGQNGTGHAPPPPGNSRHPGAGKEPKEEVHRPRTRRGPRKNGPMYSWLQVLRRSGTGKAKEDEDDNLGLQAAGSVYRAAGDIRFGVHTAKGFLRRRCIRKARKAAKKAAKKAKIILGSTQAANTAGTTAAEAGLGAAAGKVPKVLKHPAIAKFLLAVAGFFCLLMLICALLGGGGISFLGSAVEHPELTDYVQELDTDFLSRLNSMKESYEKEGDQVTLEGDENVDTDPGSLAVLATGDWTEIPLTPENKAKLKKCHAVLNSYTVSSYDETVAGTGSAPEKVIHHVEILVNVCTAEEKIDAFGFASAVKSHVLEMLGVLRQIEGEAGIQSGKGTLSGNVLAYRPLVSRYCGQYGISGYTNLALSVMQQESGGNGGDPMQSSECGYNTRYPHRRGGITDPDYSVRCGVQYLADCLRSAKCKSPDDMPGIRLALQGYNFGGGYILWAIPKGGYSQANAREFSLMEAQKLGAGSYGDVYYAPHVLRYYSALKGGDFLWPLPGHTYISSGYGSRVDPITGKAGEFHTGIDIPAPTGTKVLASAGGKVILAGWNGGYGNCVIIQHSGGIQTLYGHNSALLVREGDTVSQGQAIAKVGQTGRATGPHCHFEFRINGRHIDPAPYLKGVSRR